MANGMGSLYIGASGLQSSQNALNTTANNLANVDTKGYVRQQVLFADRNYATFDNTAAISKQQSGLGVSIADVVHTRDLFLDKYYRTEAGRQAYYEICYEAVSEIETLFQEMEGKAFQETLNDLWVSFQELAKAPESSVNQNLVVQKADLFLSRAAAVYQNLKDYQLNLNIQISDATTQINDLGKKIQELNLQIQKIEAGGVETAMNLRDERDNALDELGKLAKIEYKEMPDGIVKVKLEGVSFIDEINVFQLDLKQDMETGFMTPYWPHLSDKSINQYVEVFDFSVEIGSEFDTDIGKLKALVISRGDSVANFTDILGLTPEQYNQTTGKHSILNAQAELDQLVHGVVTAINDILSPTTSTSFTGADGTVYTNVRVWDEANAALGEGLNPPGQELFSRIGCERYTEVLANDGTTYYVYNEESATDIDRQYTIESLVVNPALIEQENLLPHLKANGEVAMDLGAQLAAVWEQDLLRLNPNDTDMCSFTEYYQRMIDDMATTGSVYSTVATTLSGSVGSIESSRQQVIGVSSDEELTNMIKYQNAYNAASRYINVVSEMLEHLITQLG